MLMMTTFDTIQLTRDPGPRSPRPKGVLGLGGSRSDAGIWLGASHRIHPSDVCRGFGGKRLVKEKRRLKKGRGGERGKKKAKLGHGAARDVHAEHSTAKREWHAMALPGRGKIADPIERLARFADRLS